MKNSLAIVLIALLSSCATQIKFPTSSVVPAATISAKKSVDKQKNISLEITAENLASAERLDPPGNNYSIWIVTKDHEVKNLGQLNIENAKKTVYTVVTPYDFDEIFITVEDQGDLDYPRGVEISRIKF